MTTTRWLVRRTTTTLLAALTVLSLVYLLVTIAPPPRGGELTVLPLPTLSEYLAWVGNLVTLEWGHSRTLRQPVLGLVWEGLVHTGAYVLPAMLLSTGLGTIIGLRTALGDDEFVSSGISATAYLASGMPNFVLGVLLLVAFAKNLDNELLRSGDPIQTVVWPALVLTTTLTAAQIRYTRNHTIEYVHSEFARLLRAAGGSLWSIARHALRNAAIPLVSLFFTELLGVLLLNIYIVESVFGIRGLGFLNFWAVMRADRPLVIATTAVFVLFGMGGNYLQDLAYVFLDPRVNTE